jgi:hypothetical protein
LLADSLMILDGAARRVTVVDTGFSMIRGFPLPGHLERALILSDGSILAVGRLGTPDAAGQPVHSFSPVGKYQASFGVDEAFVLPSRHFPRPQIAAGRRGVWVALENEYRLALWEARGKKLAEFERKAAWFAPHAPRSVDLNNAPLPWITALFEDDEGLLWVYSLVAAPDWRTGVGRRIKTAEGVAIVDQDLARLYDTRIEVLDVARGRLVAAVTVPELLVHTLGANHVVGWRSNADGGYVVDVWRFTLTGKGGS